MHSPQRSIKTAESFTSSTFDFVESCFDIRRQLHLNGRTFKYNPAHIDVEEDDTHEDCIQCIQSFLGDAYPFHRLETTVNLSHVELYLDDRGVRVFLCFPFAKRYPNDSFASGFNSIERIYSLDIDIIFRVKTGNYPDCFAVWGEKKGIHESLMPNKKRIFDLERVILVKHGDRQKTLFFQKHLGTGEYGAVEYFACNNHRSSGPKTKLALKTFSSAFNQECRILDILHASMKEKQTDWPPFLARANAADPYVIMPVYASNWKNRTFKFNAKEARDITKQVYQTCNAIWNHGLAYLDMSLGNIVDINDGDNLDFVLCDIGSIYAHGEMGISTFPPPRSDPTGLEVEATEENAAWAVVVLYFILLNVCGDAYVTADEKLFCTMQALGPCRDERDSKTKLEASRLMRKKLSMYDDTLASMFELYNERDLNFRSLKELLF